jgi:hypothetical protein
LMMKQEIVNFVKLLLPLINIPNKGSALKFVQTGRYQDFPNYAVVDSIEYIGREDVYNLEVERYHNFSINGGLIVHNSIDACRYALEDDMRYNNKVRSISKSSLGLR